VYTIQCSVLNACLGKKAAEKAIRRNILPFLKLLEKKVCAHFGNAYTYKEFITVEGILKNSRVNHLNIHCHNVHQADLSTGFYSFIF
jgi:hypothetical protein